MAAGYSKTPLLKKLGIKEGFSIKLFNRPAYYFELFEELPQDIFFCKHDNPAPVDFIHYFVMDLNSFIKDLENLQNSIKQNGMIWISWDKTKSKNDNAVNENIVRSEALKLKLVDVKVCAVDETWSGLKLVIRKDQRL